VVHRGVRHRPGVDEPDRPERHRASTRGVARRRRAASG
jgi:hypothetical protein